MFGLRLSPSRRVPVAAKSSDRPSSSCVCLNKSTCIPFYIIHHTLGRNGIEGVASGDMGHDSQEAKEGPATSWNKGKLERPFPSAGFSKSSTSQQGMSSVTSIMFEWV
jgi:hypothetical protein